MSQFCSVHPDVVAAIEANTQAAFARWATGLGAEYGTSLEDRHLHLISVF
jgi:hypothetical protein